jgi:hypothetical protein
LPKAQKREVGQHVQGWENVTLIEEEAILDEKIVA